MNTETFLQSDGIARSPIISVIVPIRNESAHLGKVLTKLVRQELHGNSIEIIVVDGNSTDNSREIVNRFSKQFPFVKLLVNNKKLSSAGRNLGIKSSVGIYVVIVDGHCDIESDHYLLNVANLFDASTADCLGRPQPLITERTTSLQNAIALVRKSWLGHNPSSLIFSLGNLFTDPGSVAVAYRRDVFKRIGLFDEHFDACEDVELNYRLFQANLSCFFSDLITINYVPRSSLYAFIIQMMRYGRGRARLIRKHKNAITISLFPPLFLIAFLLLLPFSIVAFPEVSLIPICGFTLYLFLLLIQSVAIRLGRKDKLLTLFFIPAAIFSVHVGTGFGIIEEVLLGKWCLPNKLTK